MKPTPLFILAIVSAVVRAGPAQAQGRKPKKEEPKSTSTLKDAKDSANRALNELDKGIHEAIGPIKKGANDALQAVDDTVHGRKK